jgi:flagellar hook-associated protein 3 FlgL
MSSVILTPNDRILLERLADQRQRVAVSIQRLSSGKRFEKASDSPGDVAAILNARSGFARNEQLIANFARVEMEVDSAERALSQSVRLLEQANTVGVAALSPSQNAETRASLAVQVEGLLADLVRQANTQVEGRYVFSGDSDQMRPYNFTEGAVDPVGPYAGANTSRRVEDPFGEEFSIGMTAQQVFETPGADAFAALTQLRDALLANDTSQIEANLAAVQTAESSVNGQLARYGVIQRQVRDAKAMAEKQKLSFSTQISTLEDADVYAEASILTTANNNIEAAMSARRLSKKGSLFDYLG